MCWELFVNDVNLRLSLFFLGRNSYIYVKVQELMLKASPHGSPSL